jgi:hypothetical protein
MATREKNHDNAGGKLPATAELGSEGGSYADATLQRATRTGGLPVTVEKGDAESAGVVAEGTEPSTDELSDGVHFERRRGSKPPARNG